jgi:plasmid stabilization system protein ParE
MSRLIWSEAALLDVQRIYRFLKNKNKEAAKRAIKTIRDSIKHIEVYPEIGKPFFLSSDMSEELREWTIGFGESGYVVLYHYQNQRTVIISIKHQKEAGY